MEKLNVVFMIFLFYVCRMSDMELESLEGDAEENIDELETVVALCRYIIVL